MELAEAGEVTVMPASTELVRASALPGIVSAWPGVRRNERDTRRVREGLPG